MKMMKMNKMKNRHFKAHFKERQVYQNHKERERNELLCQSMKAIIKRDIYFSYPLCFKQVSFLK